MKKTAKKMLALAGVFALVLGMTACSNNSSTTTETQAETVVETVAETAAETAEETAEETQDPNAEADAAEYTFYNSTGAAVTELYVYATGSEDKGENYAGEGLADGETVVVTFNGTVAEAEAAEFTVEFVAEGQDAMTFETLHWEVAPIQLLAADAMTGATPILFQAPEN